MSIQLTVPYEPTREIVTEVEARVIKTVAFSSDDFSAFGRDIPVTSLCSEEIGQAVRHTDTSRLSPQFFLAAVGLANFLAFAFSGFLASRSCLAYGINCAGGEWLLTTLVTTFTAFFALYEVDAYKLPELRNPQHRFAGILVAVVTGGAAGLLCCALMPVMTPALRIWPLFWMPIAVTLNGAVAMACAALVTKLTATGHLTSRLAVVGVNDYSRRFISRLIADPDQTHAFVGLYGDGLSSPPETSDLQVSGGLSDLLERANHERIDAVIMSMPLSRLDDIIRTRTVLHNLNCDIYIAAEALSLTCEAGRLYRISGHNVLKVGSRPLDDWELLQKNAIDRILAAMLLFITFPLIVIIAAAIRLDSSGPSLFRQPRQGFSNTMFGMFKFRTMYHHMADLKADRQTTRNDPRITRIGRLLRKTSLDELPQLINVLRGEMSLVGPRPHAPNTKAGGELFHNVVRDYALRHRVKPGITGWAQVNGWRGETLTREQIEQRVAHDFYYIDNWSLLLDLKIILLTLARELNSKVAF